MKLNLYIIIHDAEFAAKQLYSIVLSRFSKSLLDQILVEELRRLFDKYLLKIQDFKKANGCKELVKISELNGVASLCRLFDALATPENGVSSQNIHS